MQSLVGSIVAATTVGLLAGQRNAPPQSPTSPSSAAFAARFTPHTIDTGLTGGYQVVVSDLNRDGRPDVIALASGLTELRWYENPGWQCHVLVTGITQAINVTAYDLDGDGIPELALAHEFSNVYGQSRGLVSILAHQGDPAGRWSMKEIDRLPTSHRLRFVDIDGSGKKVLVNFPLIGPHAVAPDYRDHVALVMYRPPQWTREVITDAEEGIVHGIFATSWDGGSPESLLSGSFLGIHLLQFDRGRWSRTFLARGDPAEWPKGGTSDLVVGHLGRDRYIAAIEPWHGGNIAVYRQDAHGVWTRHLIDDTIRDGHTIGAADFDGDGQDEFIVGERAGRRSVYLYRATGGASDAWTKETLDDGDMAAAGCAATDLSGDGRPDAVCIGTATSNLKWYETSAAPRRNPSDASRRAQVRTVTTR